MNRVLATLLPELLYEPSWDWAMLEGPTVFYPEVLVHYLRHVLAHADATQDILTKAFDFLEVLSQHEDADIRKIVALCVLDPLKSDPAIDQEARRWMRPSTLGLARP